MTKKTYGPMTVGEYLARLPDDRRDAFMRLRAAIAENLPEGFSEEMSYGMPGWVVPLDAYPKGYHCAKDQALPFVSLAAQKQYISLYHLGLYAQPGLYAWFRAEYERKEYPHAIDIGKSCIRFRHPEEIPYDLVGQLAGRITPAEWVRIYEESREDRHP